jgi:predicted MPP superfamily phosphohydrolase
MAMMKLHYICAGQGYMKNMTAEIYATLSIMLICLILLTATDAVVSLILKLAIGTPFKKAFLWGCIILIVPPLAIAYGALIERNLFRIRKVEIEFKTLPEAFDGYRIAHISDIHARSFKGREKRLKKAMEKINALEPDLIAFTGDLISMNPDELEGLRGILGSLQANDGVLSVMGNHDYSMYSGMDEQGMRKAQERLIEAEMDMGWTLLLNESRIIGRGRDSVAVVGVENTSPSRHFPSKGDLPQAAAGTEGMFRILLSHDPLHWETEIVGKDYPLTLSGHTHAMQFSLMGWSPSRYMFPQYRGLYSASYSGHEPKCTSDGNPTDRQYLYVNPGLGETIFPARIGVMPEITLITLKSRKSTD